MQIDEIRTGGQSGTDRAAFDVARAFGIPISGWCPQGGWAEDMTEPPGLLTDYPEMVETPSSETIQRTEWNIRDSSACLVFNTAHEEISPGTDAGMDFFSVYDVPYFEIDLSDDLDRQIDDATAWLLSLENEYSPFILGAGGPRASEYPDVYSISYDVISRILENVL